MYRAAMDASVTRRLTDDLEIRLITAPFFLATKLEAFQGRGQRDFFASQDLEDVITVVDGRASLVTSSIHSR
jgi:predicted nucleotidyltransferase